MEQPRVVEASPSCVVIVLLVVAFTMAIGFLILSGRIVTLEGRVKQLEAQAVTR